MHANVMAEPIQATGTPTSCPYCGNNPINHRFAWVTHTLSVLVIPISRGMFIVDHPLLRQFVILVFTPYLYAFRALGMVRMSKDETKACTERSRVVWDDAIRRGIPMEQFVIMGRPVEQYRAKVRGRWVYFNSLPIPPWHTASSYAWMDDKAMLKKHLNKHGVPVPQGGSATSEKLAKRIFDSIEKPVIVKPAMGSRGRHSLTHLHTEEELVEAFSISQQLCAFVVVEEHLIGSVYRGTYVGGEIVGILRGDPPRIVGDGVSTVAKLIEIKNATKHERQKDYKVTDLTSAFLARQGLSLDSVLPQGKRVDLSEKIGLSYGGFAAEEIPITHPKTIEYLKKAGDVLGAPVVGFDFIIEDITKDPDEQKWGVIEANSLPFINLHHFPVDGDPINVAGKLWDLWDRR